MALLRVYVSDPASPWRAE